MEQYKKVGNLKVRTDLSPEKQALVNQIAKNYVNQNKKIDAEARKGYLRGGLGSVVSGLSFHPIMNIPYVGTGVGGAMYDLGQGIVAGEKAKDLAKRAGRGFVIGETVGAIPYVGKAAAKTKAGQAVVKKLDKVGEKVAQNPAVQKAYDTLMTDIKAFNPNKQTAYHGSPYDFNKFSNEAIGTGEGAQAHGYGHYAAKQKNIAENYANVLSDEKPIEIKYKGEKYKVNFNYDSMDWDIQGNVENLTPTERSLFEKIDSSRNLDHIKELELKQIDRMKRMQGRKNRFRDAQKSKDIINILDSGDLEILPTNKQLYKLSVPKDDVMLREDALMSNQPNMSNLWDEIRTERLLQDTSSLPKFKMALGVNDIDIKNAFGTKYFNEALEMAQNNPELYKDLIMQNYTGTDLYQYLTNKLGSAKAATEYLQQKGIKGISYNGGIDGEARVIFNPDDIDIVRKYYNQPTLKDIYNKFINSGAIAGAITNP
ncbi:MAG: hypothetical protein IIZ99_00210 [Turicibacter sp.]|nr:hypothetical protein [Turicibacter sp.]